MFKTRFQQLRQTMSEAAGSVAAFHRDERGDNENLGRLLILALVLVPLVVLIILFGNQIFDKAKQTWDGVMGKSVKAA
jgi:hypothetical protein